jgi:hypothetical protein
MLIMLVPSVVVLDGMTSRADFVRGHVGYQMTTATVFGNSEAETFFFVDSSKHVPRRYFPRNVRIPTFPAAFGLNDLQLQ